MVSFQQAFLTGDARCMNSTTPERFPARVAAKPVRLLMPLLWVLWLAVVYAAGRFCGESNIVLLVGAPSLAMHSTTCKVLTIVCKAVQNGQLTLFFGYTSKEVWTQLMFLPGDTLVLSNCASAAEYCADACNQLRQTRLLLSS